MHAEDIFRIDMALGYLASALCIRLTSGRDSGRWTGSRRTAQLPRSTVSASSGWSSCYPGLSARSAAGFAAGGLRRPCHRTARNPRTVDGACALPILAAGPGFQSGRSRRPRARHSAGGQREPAVSGRAAGPVTRSPCFMCQRFSGRTSWRSGCCCDLGAHLLGRQLRPCRLPRMNNQEGDACDGTGDLSWNLKSTSAVRRSWSSKTSPFPVPETPRASCSCVFITIGPYQATGSCNGLPETSRKRMPSSPACTVTSSPLSKRISERLSASRWRRGVQPVRRLRSARPAARMRCRICPIPAKT